MRVSAINTYELMHFLKVYCRIMINTTHHTVLCCSQPHPESSWRRTYILLHQLSEVSSPWGSSWIQTAISACRAPHTCSTISPSRLRTKTQTTTSWKYILCNQQPTAACCHQTTRYSLKCRATPLRNRMGYCIPTHVCMYYISFRLETLWKCRVFCHFLWLWSLRLW